MCELLVDRRTHPDPEGADRHHIYVLTPSNRRCELHSPAGGSCVCIRGQFVASVFNLHTTDVRHQLQTSVFRKISLSLQSDIMDVNQIFKDLAVMIHDQGEMIGG